MKNITKLTILIAGSITLSLSSCAPVAPAGPVDLNGDGKISTYEKNAHYKKVNAQQVTPNSALRQTRNALWDARSIRNSTRYW